MMGQYGWIRQIDEDGDMSISFDGRYQKRQWVFKKHSSRIAPIGKAWLDEDNAAEGSVYEGWQVFDGNSDEKLPFRVHRSEITSQYLRGVAWQNEDEDWKYYGTLCSDGIIRGGIHDLSEFEEEIGQFELSPVAVECVELYDHWKYHVTGNLAGSADIDKFKLAEEHRKLWICAQQAIVAICDDSTLDQPPKSASARVLLEKLSEAMTVKTPFTEEIAMKGKLVNVLGKLEALQQLKQMDARSTE